MEHKHKKRRRLYIVLAIIATLLLTGIFVVNRTLENLVKKEVSNQLNSSPNSLYMLEFEDVKINVFSGSLKVINLTVTPTDSAYHLLDGGKIKKLIVSQIPVFKIMGLKYLEFIKEQTIDIVQVELTDFTVDYLINTKAEHPENKNTFALHDVFSANFKGAEIENIHVDAEAINFYHVGKRDSSFFTIDSVHVYLSDIIINSETLKNPIPVNFKDVRISTGHFSLNSMKFYTIYTTDVKFDVMESSLSIDGFKLKPNYSKEDYNKQIKYNNDWFSISTESIKLNGFSIEELEFNGLLSFTSLEVKGPNIEIYRDKRLPDAPFKYKSLLGGMVHKIPMDLNIDTVLISDGKLKYQEQTDVSDQPGTVFFDPLKLAVYHVTNDSSLIAENNIMRVDFHGRIMGEANLDAEIDIDLASKHEEFSISGTLEPVTGTAFNPMVEHLLPVKITSGDISKTAFNFKANDDISRGELIMEYENLGVEVSKGKDHDKKSKLISLVANGLLKSKNTPDHHKYRTGTIRFERRKDKAIVNYLWNSCKIGIISIVAPIADKTEKAERKEQKEEKKEERERNKKNRNK